MNRLKVLRLYLAERVSSCLGNRNSLRPPQKLIDAIAGGDFEAVGNEFLRHFVEIGGLKPDHRVLDIGCGCGRMAVPLMKYLSEKGSYEGFDIVGVAVDWCQRHIAAQDSRFRFQQADVYNKAYNPRGSHQPKEYQFPYPADSFDFVFLTSVFTHMLSADMQHYLSEIARVLKPNGQCMISMFLINPESQALMDAGQSAFRLTIARQDCMILREKRPEEVVGYAETFIRQCFARNNLEIIEPIHFGAWSGRKNHLSAQDIVVARKVR
jgi:ubiquinone/menaquinone biosynthesis C-methylase UbiE